MVCMGLEPGVEGWEAQTNPVSSGGRRPTWCQVLLSLEMHFLLILFSDDEWM